jgi:hypothetical protein
LYEDEDGEEQVEAPVVQRRMRRSKGQDEVQDRRADNDAHVLDDERDRDDPLTVRVIHHLPHHRACAFAVSA